MEYVEGPTLADVTRERPLPPRKAAEYLSQVADAIEYAHQMGILHRDLKPGNVPRNKQDQVKVTDFGLAKQVESDSGITASGAILGTPSYMPPEQALGTREKIGPASDVYSLGAMLYAMLTGRAPFQAASTAQTLLQVINNPPVALRDLDPGLPRDLETICGKCLEKEPSSRYASAAELAADLRRFLAGEPILARRANAWERSVRWCRRNPIGSALIASLGVAVVLSMLALNYVTRAQRLQRLSDLQTAFTSQLDQPRLGTEYLLEMDRISEQVGALNADDAARMRSRFTQSYSEYLRQQIEQPRLEDAVRSQIAESLVAVRKRDSDPVWETLDQLLASSASRWETVMSLTPPFENITDVFSEEHVLQKDGELFIKVRDETRIAFVPTRVETRGDVLIEVEFPDGWQKRRYLGIAVDCEGNQDDDRHFELMLHAPTDLAWKALSNLPVLGKSPEAELQMDLLRQGVRLGTKRVPRPASGPLRLVFRREGRQLQLQLNQYPPLQVEELFPLPASAEMANLAIWDLTEDGSGNLPLSLSELKLSRRRLAPEPHPLEAGDAAYAQGNFVEALDHFQNRSADWSSELQKEAKYKAALALAQLKRRPEAEVLLAELAGGQDTNWRFRAYAQLWALALQAAEFEQAEFVSQQILADENFEELVVHLPRDTINQLVQHYRESAVGDVDQFSLPPERLAEMERATSILEKLGAPVDTIVDSLWDLANAYVMSDHADKALETVSRTLEEFPYDEDTLWGILNLYSKVMHATGLPYPDATERLARYILDEQGEPLSGKADMLDILIRHHLSHDDPKPALALLKRDDLQSVFARTIDLQAEYCLLLGLALEMDQSPEEAQTCWRYGLKLIRESNEDLDFWSAGTLAILGGLTEEVVAEDVPRMLSALTVDQLGGPVFDQMRQQFVTNDQIASIIRYLYRGPRGRQLLAAQYLNKYAGREAIFLMGRNIGLEIGRQMVGGIEQAATFEFSPELIEELSEFYDHGQRLAWDHQLGHLQATQAVMAFRGITGFLGWAGLRSSTPQELHPPLGYVLGSHLANIGKVDAGRQVLAEVLPLAKDGSALKNAIEEKLTSLEPVKDESASAATR